MKPPPSIQELLASLGFRHPDAYTAARAVLEGQQLTRPGKLNIAAEKRPAVEAALRGSFFVACADPRCQDLAQRTRAGRPLLPVGQLIDCWICRGSSNQRLAALCVEHLRRRGFSKMVILGGSPATRPELEALLPGVELRLIDTDKRRSAQEARQDLLWADLVLVWGSTELSHSTALLYTQDRSFKHIVKVSRRGIAALLEEAVEHLQKNGKG